MGSTVDQQPEGEVVRQSQEEVASRAKFFQPAQPIPKPICDRSGQPDNTQDVFVVKGETSRSQEISVKSFHEELCSSDRSGQPDELSPTDYSKLDYDRAWSSQELKSEVTAHHRSGQPDKTSWSMVQQVRPHHGETLLDGTAQSVRYGEPLRDRSGQPDNVNSQEAANSQNFIMGSDATEFVNRVNDEVRKRQKRMSNVAGSGEEHSIIW